MPNGIFTLKQQVLAIREGGWPGQKPLAVDYLVVAGGGAGNENFNAGGPGGGGAGGLLQGNIGITPGSAITVTVGAGGAGVYNAGPSTGASGANSVFGSIVATGGGGGSAGNNGATSGGSGGGGGGILSVVGFGAQGTAGQGNAGGKSSATGTESTSGGGGGGGAGTVGLDGTSGGGGNGGAGIASDISGTRTAYAGGGGAGNYGGTRGLGGAGGGGNGGNTASSQPPTNGTANTGGGGGGGGGRASATANGGSGIVILSYPDIYAAAASTTGSPTVSTSGSGSISNGPNSGFAFASNAAFAPGTGAFTWEAWIKPTGWGGTQVISAVSGTGGILVFGNGTTFTVRAYGVADQLTYGTPPTTGAWTHVVVVRSGTTLSIYYNGTRVATTTNSYNFIQDNLTVGNSTVGASEGFDGLISNLRLVKGTAVYDPTQASLTVPTTPLTNITNTSLLLNTVSGAFTADSSSNSFTPIPQSSNRPSWNADSPFATGLGYKNRVYTWTSSGSITF
jgi:hypothetical protein